MAARMRREGDEGGAMDEALGALEEAAARPFDVVVVGGGPAGATAAETLARAGHRVALLDRAGRTKPCGGAVPPQLLVDFDVPRTVLESEVRAARMISPSAREVEMPIEGGFVGMVDRGFFDEWLRRRAALAGARRVRGRFIGFDDAKERGALALRYRAEGAVRAAPDAVLRARYVIGADGASSAVARAARIGGAAAMPRVFAYHEIVRAPEGARARAAGFRAERCDVVYDGAISPDFYGWVFPHGRTVSVGTGTAREGVSIRQATAELRRRAGLAEAETVRTEGAPIPLKPLPRWDDGHRVLLAGDAAGCVAPASGEGIYYAMSGGRMAAEAVAEALATGDARALRRARRRFLRAHGRVFWVLGLLQRFWYSSDRRRERFVTMCADRDVQRLTWEAYLHKRLVRRDPLAHLRVFVKDVGHLVGIVPPAR